MAASCSTAPSPPPAALTAVSLALCLGACGPGPEAPPEPRPNKAMLVAAAPDSAALETFVYDCADRRFIVQLLADTAWLYFADTVVTLDRVPAASGARYADSPFVYRSTGEQATIEIPEGRYEGCRMDKSEASWQAARLRGVDFRGLGQEPGWLLEIFYNDSIVFLADYGTRRFVGSTPEPRVHGDGDTTRYVTRAGTHRLEVTIARDSCTDIMSGFRFPATVAVTLDSARYQGCGRELWGKENNGR